MTIVEPAAGSVLAQLQAAAAAQQEDKRLILSVGGSFGDLLQIVYKPLDPTAMDRYIAKRARIIERGGNASDISSTEAAMDLMAQACIEVLGGGEKLEINGMPVRLNAQLATLLELPFPEGFEPTARDVILKLFGSNAMAIDTHSSKVLDWMREGGVEVAGLGEGLESED